MASSPVQQVLVNIPETLDAIFKFLNPQNLVKCRKVCRRWRAISNIHLQRRLTIQDFEQLDVYFGTMTSGHCKIQKVRLAGYKDTLEAKNSSLSSTDQTVRKLVADCCLVIQDACSAAAVNTGGEYELGWRKVKPMPWFVSKVLEIDWLPSVEKLVLDRCLTVDDWNAAANAILAQFPGLTELQLLLPQERSNVLPLVYAELLEKESQQVALPSIKKVVLQYYIWFNSTSNSIYTPYPGEFKLEGVKWFSGVDWDFLNQCPYLQDVLCSAYFGDSVFVSARCRVAKMKASRSVLQNENTVQGHCPWDISVWHEYASPRDRCQNIMDSSENRYNSVLAQDISNLISTINPANLQIPLLLKLHSALASSKHIANTAPLEFSEWPSALRLRDQVETVTHDVALAFKFAASFDNIQKLDFPYFCSRYPLDLEDVDPLPPTRFAKSLVTLMIRSSNDWMQDNLNRLMPNVQLLIVSCTRRSGCFYDLPKVFKLCSSLSQLKHLVLLLRTTSDRMNAIAVRSEVTEQDIQCLNGLTSLTVIARLRVEVFLELLTEQCLDICSSVKSIRKLGVFSRFPVYENQANELDVSESCLPIPDHMTVRVGSTALLGPGEAEFDGMEHSHVTWQKLLED